MVNLQRRNSNKLFTSVFFTETEQRPYNIYLSAYLKGKTNEQKRVGNVALYIVIVEDILVP